MPAKNFFWGIREKLIGIFVLIKVIPLLIIAWIAWEAAMSLGGNVTNNVEEMSTSMRDTVAKAGDLAIQDSIRALDLRSREAIEQRTTDTAQAVAAFLYGRDQDILFAAKMEPTQENYTEFLAPRTRPVVLHAPWKLKADGSGWEPANEPAQHAPNITPKLPDNEKDFHYRPPETWGHRIERPLFLEMAFIDANGMEQVKVVTSPLADPKHKNLSRKEETWWKAEDFFHELQGLMPGEIYVSNVIGPYVPSRVIGPYTPAKAKKAGLPYAPEESGYAGKENPVGKRFQGIVRWATPVVRDARVIGWVTLVLDHTHIMEFTDHLTPTPERYTAISDPGSGNYAFMWDYKGRNISHPRDYFIVGYDPETGEPVMPWLGKDLYADWQQSGKSYAEWQETAPIFEGQSLKNKPNVPLIKAGTIALDCRYISFAPQCAGWNNLTQRGGSGSFVIYWSGLWKLTTAAVIPYYTGQYGSTPRGFGYVTIGANVHEFHKPAQDSEKRIHSLVAEQDGKMKRRLEDAQSEITFSLKKASTDLVGSTAIMIVLVIMIAVFMAGALTKRITSLIRGIQRIQGGDLSHRMNVRSKDEMGQLTRSFNSMADSLRVLVDEHDRARQEAEASDRAKTEFLANMSHELRTPLNAILGFSEIIRQETMGPVSPPRYRSYAEDIHHSGEHLLGVINDILDVARIEAGKMELDDEEFEVRAVMDSVLRIFQGRAAEARITLESNIPHNGLVIRGDQRRIKQVLLNLLSNSVKFTPEGGQVLLSSQVEAGQGLIFRISDNGIGMTPSQISVALTPFGQVDGRLQRKYEGTGLGLPLCKAFVELHGGTLQVESEPDQGTTITVILPPDRVQSAA